MMLQASGQAMPEDSSSNARYATLPTQLTNGSKTEKSTLVPNAPEPVDKCKFCGSTSKCIMCHGTGVYPYRLPAIKWGVCEACLGDGIDHV